MTRVNHRTYQSRRSQWDRIEHALEGQDAMRENAALYLKRPGGLAQNEFSEYVKGAHFYPVAAHTLTAMTGLCFRKRPQITVPPRLTPMLKTASYDGNPIEVVAEDILREVIAYGRSCALLDMPVDGNDVLTTPHLSHFHPSDILDWQMGVVDGVKRLAMLRLNEFKEDLEDTGTEQHLVLTLEPAYTIRRYHVATNGNGKTLETQIDDDIVPTFGGGPIFYIPAIIFGPSNLSPDTEKSPLLDLVDVNIAHFQSSADLSHALWLSAMPTPVVTGNLNAEQKPTSVGPGTMWFLPENATAFYLSAPSDAHASLRLDLQDKEARMAALGATMILSGQRRQEAAETASMRYQQDTSMLLSTINQVEAGFRTLLTWASDWVQPGEVTVEFNKDLISTTLSHQTIMAMLRAWQSGAISHDTFLDAMRKGELVTRTNDDEKDMIDEEGGDPDLFVVTDDAA